MSDFKEILNRAKKEIKEVSVQEVHDKLNPENGFTLLDVREGDEDAAREREHIVLARAAPRTRAITTRSRMRTDSDKVLTRTMTISSRA